MRTSLIIGFLALSFAACQNADKSKGAQAFTPQQNPYAEKVDSANFTAISWLDGDKDLGTVTEGQQVEVIFHFKNSGDKPLIIYSVQPACGCTVAESPKEPILPGKEGLIKGSFNSNGRVGTNNKSIYVKANTTGGMDHTLKFKVEVIKK